MLNFFSPDLLLALGKITALLLLALALAPFLSNPKHRARFWTFTILVLPILFLTSFTTPLLKFIPPISSDRSLILSSNSGSTAAELNSNDPDPSVPPDLPDPTALDFSEFEASLTPTKNPDLLPKGEAIPPPRIAKETPVTTIQPLTIALITGSLVSLIPFLITFLKLLRLPQFAAIDPPLSLWEKIHQSCRKTPPLFFTPSPAAPFTCGILNPRVLLPDDSLSWPHRQLKSTLLHEAAHLRRRDPLIRFLATLIRAAFWFHPLVWIANRQLISAQEQACDQAALSHGVHPHDYAEDLLACATHSHLTPSQALSMANSSQLGTRIRHILEKPKPNSMKTITCTTLITLLATLTFTSLGFSEEKSTSQPKEISIESTRHRGTILDRNNKPLAIDDQSGLRSYPTGKSTGNLIGYVGNVTSKDSVQPQGKAGIEKSGDAKLAKKEDIKLTIDTALQKHCYDLLAAQEHPGSVVVQDPTTGEILALVSYPSFDPNLFIPFITKGNFETLLNDEKKPFFDYSIMNSTTPGSIAKPLVALAADFAGLHNPEIHCKGFMELGNVKIRDWKTDRDELLRIPEALETSCNTYFMELAIRTGEEPLTQIGEILHLNEAPLDSLTSSKGHWNKIPDGEAYTPAILALTSLGQGRTSLTPLHVSTITSAIASGTWHQPNLLQGQPPTKPSTSLIGQGQITADSLNTIRKGMHLTIHGKRGTAKSAELPGVNLAGKTGTAMIKKDKESTHNSWFTGYGPFEEPKYSVTVLLSGANSGGKFAAPIAKEVFEYLLIEN